MSNELITVTVVGSETNATVTSGAEVVVTIGDVGPVTWSAVSGKPTTFPPQAHSHEIGDVTGLTAALAQKVELDPYGKVQASQLPSFVDDVLEYANAAARPATGETGKIYVTIDNGKVFRWSGSQYIEISAAPGSTDAVPEGTTNLYHTTGRAAAAAPVQSVAGRTGAVTLAVADVSGAVATTDARLSDARVPTDGSVTDAKIASAGLSTSSLNWAAIQPWAANTAYAKGDLVSFAGIAYRRSAAGTSGATFNIANWQQITPSDFVASQIASGTVATARLGSGTANNTTFLRGDQTYAAPPVTSVDGSTGVVTITKAEVFDFTATTKPAAASGSGGNYTWTIPAGAKRIDFFCVGAGAGGGSGRRGAAGTACCGGGGGGCGGWSEISYDVSKLPSTTLSITAPAGGAGGAAPTANDTNGNAGSNVDPAGLVSCAGLTIAVALSATGGQGGTSAATVAGGGAQWTSLWTPNIAGAVGRSAAAGAAGGTQTFTSGQGGGGGGADASNNQYAGGAGGSLPILFLGGAAPTAGTAGGGAGANGVSYHSRVATGGAGGGGSSSGGGGAGGNGGFPGGGGGGGGGGRNGATGGAGGNGGGALVRITVWY
jgi:hypothetical protein